jgi:hypothetical protein
MTDLWCVHIRSTGDLIPAPTRQHAEQAAQDLQQAWNQVNLQTAAIAGADKRPPPLDPAVERWPHTPQHHQHELERLWDAWWAQPAPDNDRKPPQRPF